MKLGSRVVLVGCLLLSGASARAQVKDMPSQAEFDPILENADGKVKDFLATLTKYRAAAAEIDNERLEKDLNDFRQLREIIQTAHSGTGNHGINLVRVFGIVTSLDDAAMDAAVWSNLLTIRIRGPHEQSLLFFAMAVQENGRMLREVSNQLFHPAFRLMGAADEVMRALGDGPPKSKRE